METEARAAASDEEAAALPNDPTEDSAAETDAKLEAERARSGELYKELQYARAEIENVRKRAERIAAERLSSGRRTLLGSFLPVLDNLRRALAYDDSESLRGGLQATLRGFDALLAGAGVRPLDVVGKPFDPRFAEAIATRESDDVDDGTVLEEAAPGYLLGDELLRPAQVVVAKRAKPDADAAS